MASGQQIKRICVFTQLWRLLSCDEMLPFVQAGAGSATLSMAYAAAKFAEACLKAMRGEGRVIECAYVASTLTEHPFFASPVRLGRNGIAGVWQRQVDWPCLTAAWAYHFAVYKLMKPRVGCLASCCMIACGWLWLP